MPNRTLAAIVLVAAIVTLGCDNIFGPSDDSQLSSLSLEQAVISPAFEPGVFEYTATVPWQVAQVTVVATTSNTRAQIIAGAGSHALGVGETAIAITVEAESGSSSSYTITVTRSEPDSNADLASLSMSGVTLEPTFDPAVTSYSAVVAQETLTVTVAAVPVRPGATVAGIGEIDLDIGMNSLSIFVHAQDGTPQTYSVVVERLLEHALERTFRARTSTDGTWYQVPSTLRGITRRVLVYVENSQSVSNTVGQNIADEVESSIYDMIEKNFADVPDIDDNGKVILLLLDIIDGFAGSGGYVAGYFDPVHMFSTDTFSQSNQADMVFMDVNPGVAGSQSFFRTAAHELQHLVNFGATFMVDGRSQDLWINEGLSAGAEYLYEGSQVTSRINYHNNDPNQTIRYGNSFFVWNGYWEQVVGDTLANYSTVYLFFQWLQLHASNGTGIYKDILGSSHRDFRTVVDAATSRINWSLSSWESVMSTWRHANILNNSSGLRGYKGRIQTVPWSFLNTSGISTSLSPGEAVLIRTSGDRYTYSGGSGASIRYHGINTASSAVDTSGPTYFGDYVLVFNANSNNQSADEVAVLPSVSSLESESFTLAVEYPAVDLPSVYPVDVHFGLDHEFSPESVRYDHNPSGTGNAFLDRAHR